MIGLVFVALAVLLLAVPPLRGRSKARAAERARLLRAAEVAVAAAQGRCWHAQTPRLRRWHAREFPVLTRDEPPPRAARVLDLYR